MYNRRQDKIDPLPSQPTLPGHVGPSQIAQPTLPSLPSLSSLPSLPNDVGAAEKAHIICLSPSHSRNSVGHTLVGDAIYAIWLKTMPYDGFGFGSKQEFKFDVIEIRSLIPFNLCRTIINKQQKTEQCLAVLNCSSHALPDKVQCYTSSITLLAGPWIRQMGGRGGYLMLALASQVALLINRPRVSRGATLDPH